MCCEELHGGRKLQGSAVRSAASANLWTVGPSALSAGIDFTSVSPVNLYKNCLLEGGSVKEFHLCVSELSATLCWNADVHAYLLTHE